MSIILVVDDDPVSQRVLGARLRKAGHSAVGASSGQGALDRLAEVRCDLAILDIGLPEMDGLTLLRILRADPNYKAMPIVMLTGSGQNEICTEAEAAGADAFLLKPTSSNELIETINRLLSIPDAIGISPTG